VPDLAEETFQGLLLIARGRTGLTQREVATRLGMHTRSVQGWESGANYPTAESLQLLVATYLAANGFSAANERAEAAAATSGGEATPFLDRARLHQWDDLAGAASRAD
jgi:transcriptional regulator with XRE-family HTH domain